MQFTHLDTIKMLTVEQIAHALEKKDGNITEAAKALKVTRQALHLRIKDDDALRDVLTSARESLVDMTESEARKQIKQGNTAMIIFTLKTLGKSRGYVERIEQEHSGSVDLVVKGYVNVSPDEWPERKDDSNL